MKDKAFFISKTIFFVLIGIFILLLSYFIFLPVSFKQSFFLFAAILSFIFFILGVALIVYALKLKILYKLRLFLVLTGVSASGFLVSVLLHNLLYALSTITHFLVLKYLFEVFHIAFFISAIFICPLGFLTGIIGSIILFRKMK